MEKHCEEKSQWQKADKEPHMKNVRRSKLYENTITKGIWQVDHKSREKNALHICNISKIRRMQVTFMFAQL